MRSPLADKTFTTFGTKHRSQGNDAGGNVKSDNWRFILDERKPKLNGAGEIAGAACRNVWTIATAPFSDWGETVRQVRVAWDAPDDGKKRKASPDCLVHGDQADPAANVLDDAHADGSLNHSERNDGDPAQAQASGSAPTGQPLARLNGGQSSDLPLLACLPVATPHSTQNHRTGLDPATNQPCTVSGETDAGTGRMSEAHEQAGLVAHTLGNNSAPAVSDDNPSNQTADCTVHTRDEQALSSASDPSNCTCEWYIEKTEKTSHFATFPPALAERCIKAGTSERDVAASAASRGCG